MNSEGTGEAVMVGTGAGVSVGRGVGVAGVEQAVNRMGSRHRPEKKRGMLSKRQVETIGELSHGFRKERIQIGIWRLKHLFCDRR